MSSDNTLIFSSEKGYNLYIDNTLKLSDQSYANCVIKLNDVIREHHLTNQDRNFRLDKQNDTFILVSYPKNYSTRYERVELVSNITICEN